jgi:predicted RNA-binding protein associated with RNAse of E/G family
MDVNALPTIVETKRTLTGTQKTFACRVLARTRDALTVLFVSDRPYQVAGLELPTGTVTFGHFWAARPYNVYHWLTPTGATLGLYFSLADEIVIGPDALSYRDLTVDLLALPGAAAAVLDEHELPPELDATTRQRITRALHTAEADLPQLQPLLEARADALWSQLFGGARR